MKTGCGYSMGKVFLAWGFSVCVITGNVTAQRNSSFDFSLGVDYEAAEQTLDFFENRISDAGRIAKLRGNQLAAETSVLLARTSKSSDDFRDQLELGRNIPSFESDVYGFFPAKKRIPELRKLLQVIKRRQLDRRIVSTIAQYFPPQAHVATRFSVYFVVIGNERAAAFERRVVWNFDTPTFVHGDEGEPVIVVNLARIIDNFQDEHSQFIEVLSTTAHECFHAAYSVMQKSLPDSVKANTPVEYLLDLVQNEGCAYFLSLETHLGGMTPNRTWFNGTSRAVVRLSFVLAEMCLPNLSDARAQQLLMDANLSGSFDENYGATSGMRMAYEIDRVLGRPALTETLLKGGKAFILAYQQACIQDPSLPNIGKSILHLIGRNTQ